MQCRVPSPHTSSTQLIPVTLAIRKTFRKYVEREAVVRVVEYRDKHRLVGDVEIRVTGRETDAIEPERRRHGKCARTQGHRLHTLPVFEQWLVVRIGCVVFRDDDDGIGTGEARQIVDMPVRVVTAIYPD